MGKRIGRFIWYVAFICSIGGMAYSGRYLASYYLMTYQADKEYNNLQVLGSSNDDGIDFTKLMEINSETVGWIRIEGTNIDYPIVQGDDNEKYISTTFSNKKSPSGSIFMDNRNAADFSDRHTFIYGQYMKNQTMFEALFNYQGQSFFDDNPTFTIFTPEGEFTYEIFSAYVTSAISNTYILTFQNDDEFEDYLQYVTNLSMINTDVTVTKEDRIVILSSSDYQSSNARMVIQGRLIQ